MSGSDQEIEVKFYLTSLEGFESRVIAHGAKLIQPRVFENNLRFDTTDRLLTDAHRVLRLRNDSKARLTYKEPALPDQTVSVRREIEFEVSSFDEARCFLEALGYEVSIRYEKYRRTYVIENCQIMIDEMPFGDFAEIEGEDAASIRSMAEILGLNWDSRCVDSYMVLFNRLLANRGIKAANLTFDELSGQQFTFSDLELTPADE